MGLRLLPVDENVPKKIGTDLKAQLSRLNKKAQEEKRHLLQLDDDFCCTFCKNSVHKHYALKFANRLCPRSCLDQKGSHTRAMKVSLFRHGIVTTQVQAHNQIALDNSLHFLINENSTPECPFFCGKTFRKAHLKSAMGQLCPHKHIASNTFSNSTTVRRRIYGKQPAPTGP